MHNLKDYHHSGGFLRIRRFLRLALIALIFFIFPVTVRADDIAMQRMYNPNSGEHFYTSSSKERDSLVQAGWRYEGVGWKAPDGSAFPVYRLYNPNAGDHHYTVNYREMRTLIKAGWRYEGIGWYSDVKKGIPVYREYNPNAKTGAHNFTVSAAENDLLVHYGWRAEGIAWYGTAGTKKTRNDPENIPEGTPYWRITQYASVTGQQGMFYTIEDQDGNLAIIDGGYTEDADQVTGVIRAHHNHVTAWIITHPHPDHVGALNAILQKNAEDGRKIRIDHIYTTKVNRKRYEATARPYDGIGSFETFYSLTEKLPELTYLQENDETDILGLHMKVLHAWDEHVDEQTKNLCNDGSLMFTLSGNNQRFLFCGDTQKEMEQYMIPAHQEELRADYVQCGHHGNWGLTTSFYDLVNPRVAFLDAPSYILNDRTGKFDGPALKQYFKEKGVTVYALKGAPHTVILT